MRAAEPSGDAARQRLAAWLLAKVAAERVRQTDLIGWWTDQAALGVILPGTSAQGAMHLIEAVERLLQERVRQAESPDAVQAELDCEIFPYSAVAAHAGPALPGTADEG